MAVWIDGAALLPRPCYITQTLSPLPTKIHLCSHTNLKIHHPDTCIETMTIMTARDGSQNSTTHVLKWQLLFEDQFLEMKLSAEIVFFCKEGLFKLYFTYLYRQAVYLAPIVLQA